MFPWTMKISNALFEVGRGGGGGFGTYNPFTIVVPVLQGLYMEIRAHPLCLSGSIQNLKFCSCIPRFIRGYRGSF